MKRASRQPDPTPALGVAAYAMLTSLLSVMAQNGDGEAVTEVMAGARRYCQQEGSAPSSTMKQALRYIDSAESKLALLSAKPLGSSN